MTDRNDELARLRAENSRLVGLLEAHGVAWQAPASILKPSVASSLTTDEKVALFGRLFRGRNDVYPVRWESKAGKSGYSPACANEWRPGIRRRQNVQCEVGYADQRKELGLMRISGVIRYAMRGYRVDARFCRATKCA